MFRISDLNKKDQPGPPAPGSPSSSPPPAPQMPPSIIPADAPAVPPPIAAPASMELEQACGRLYEGLVECVKGLFAQARSGQTLHVADARQLIEQLPAMKSDQSQVLLALLERHSQDNYLYTHAVNVAILAHHLSRRLSHDPEMVHSVALAGLLMDIGMAGQAEELAALPRKLTAEEWNVIAKHPAQALEHLNTTRDVPPEVLAAISSHHRRPDGGGYPDEQGPGSLGEMTKVLIVCDVYDALTHPRAHRKRLSPAQAIKVLVDGAGGEFERRVVKVLVDELSLYPRGSLVRLSTHEVARVDRVRLEAPLRPIVLILRDANHALLPTPRRVDLVEQPFVYIKDIVTDDEA